MGYRSEGSNVHLAFGSAWHDAMEHLLTVGKHDKETVAEAYRIFVRRFNKEMGDEVNNHYAKNRENALVALSEYAQTWLPDTALHTEIAGTAPISPSRLIYFKLDSLIRDKKGKLWSMEHKTTGRLTSAWKDRWEYDFQTMCYNHVVHCIEGDIEQVGGVNINGAVLRKSSNEFLRIPVSPSGDKLQLWLWEANHWIDQIEWNMEMLAETSPSDDIMVAFPRNTSSCAKFGCDFPGLCSSRCNPLQWGEEPPIGYKKEFWDPRREDAKVKATPSAEGKIELEPAKKEDDNE